MNFTVTGSSVAPVRRQACEWSERVGIDTTWVALEFHGECPVVKVTEPVTRGRRDDGIWRCVRDRDTDEFVTLSWWVRVPEAPPGAVLACAVELGA